MLSGEGLALAVQQHLESVDKTEGSSRSQLNVRKDYVIFYSSSLMDTDNSLHHKLPFGTTTADENLQLTHANTSFACLGMCVHHLTYLKIIHAVHHR